MAKGIPAMPWALDHAGGKLRASLKRACRGLGLREGNEPAAMVRIVAAALVLLLSASTLAAAEGRRVALIVGMGEYQHLSGLTNPVPDAKAVAAELRDHGFEISEHYNL